MIQILLIAVLVVGFYRGWRFLPQAFVAAALAFVTALRVTQVVQDSRYGVVTGMIVFVAWFMVWLVNKKGRNT